MDDPLQESRDAVHIGNEDGFVPLLGCAIFKVLWSKYSVSQISWRNPTTWVAFPLKTGARSEQEEEEEEEEAQNHWVEAWSFGDWQSVHQVLQDLVQDHCFGSFRDQYLLSMDLEDSYWTIQWTTWLLDVLDEQGKNCQILARAKRSRGLQECEVQPSLMGGQIKLLGTGFKGMKTASNGVDSTR
ncbi:hypothetical protein BT96DRAFT_937677 [Gymnopus androsaceus JB14]|uniref:Uncharacterized protein n=1 Tax=Gymnopus androsaceus JB14 TaxID=1447944 RepID=A0A6A4HVA4_9AGAR|nr:hypothetical protein BT96DRAFT_937677 [Gymnopus androsaceus JB14]